MRKRLLDIYWTLRRAIAPQVRFSQYFYEEALIQHVTSGCTWLDIGCGRSVLPPWRSEQERQLICRPDTLIGLDYDLESLRTNRSIRLRVRGDVVQLPFKSASFELVTANMVVEHLLNPDEQFKEIARVLKPKGVFLLHTPNAAGYGVVVGRFVPEFMKGALIRLLQGRSSEDVFETHYRANHEHTIAQLALSSGLKADVRFVLTDAIFGMVPPIAAVELLWLRLLSSSRLQRLRPNIVAVLRKDA